MAGDEFRIEGVRSQRVRRLLHIDQHETEKLGGIFVFLCHLIPVLAQVHPVIESFLGQQRLVVATLDYPAAVDDQHLVGRMDGAQPVCNDESCPAGH